MVRGLGVQSWELGDHFDYFTTLPPFSPSSLSLKPNIEKLSIIHSSRSLGHSHRDWNVDVASSSCSLSLHPTIVSSPASLYVAMIPLITFAATPSTSGQDQFCVCCTFTTEALIQFFQPQQAAVPSAPSISVFSKRDNFLEGSKCDDESQLHDENYTPTGPDLGSVSVDNFFIGKSDRSKSKVRRKFSNDEGCYGSRPTEEWISFCTGIETWRLRSIYFFRQFGQ